MDGSTVPTEDGGMDGDVGLIAVAAAGYLVGSVPFAFLIGMARGVDLRRVGSGNPGAGNLTRAVGLGHGVAAAVLDGLKGLVPVVACLRLGLAPELAVMAGIGAVIGHNWSVFLRGRGGRGLATSVGAVLAVAPALLVWTAGWAVAGWRIGGGLAGFVGWGLLPVFAVAMGQPALVVFLTVALALVMAARRIQGNPGRERGLRASVSRLLWDTDREPAADTADEVVVP